MWISQKNKIALFKDVLDLDLKPHSGAGTIESGVMMWIPALLEPVVQIWMLSDMWLLRYTLPEKL